MTDIKKYEPLWGAWHVDSLIGEGSFGKVYKIRREEFGNMYHSAVKVITIPQSEIDLRQTKNEGMDDASAKSYFHAFVVDIIQEISLMSEFRGNSNIVSFEDHKVIEKTDGIGWDILIRMELLKSLSELVNEKPLNLDEVIKLGIHICRALEVCALKNTIHRDIKPDNIFVSQFGDFKLGDFGIARQIERTSSGLSKKGTYTYMAPEVFRGYEYGASVDTYSLGIVMYRFLNQNRTPFLPDFPTPITPKSREEALQRRMEGKPLPYIKSLSAELNGVLQKACAYDRGNRFATATEMREALEALSGVKSHVPVVMAINMPEKAEADTDKTEYVGSMDGARSIDADSDKTEYVSDIDGAVDTKMDFDKTEYVSDHEAAAVIQGRKSKSAAGIVSAMPQHKPSERMEGGLAGPSIPLPSPKEAPAKKISRKTIALIAASLCGLVLLFGIVYFVGMDGAEEIPMTQMQPEDDGLAEAESLYYEPEPEDVQEPISVGDIIEFGDFEWLVLDVRDNQALIITKHVITRRAYHGGNAPTSWNSSDIRWWLNNNFFQRFDPADQALINET